MVNGCSAWLPVLAWSSPAVVESELAGRRSVSECLCYRNIRITKIHYLMIFYTCGIILNIGKEERRYIYILLEIWQSTNCFGYVQF